MSTIILMIAYLLNIIDLIFTTHWVKLYGIGIEANPIGRWLYTNNIAGFVKIFVVGCVFAVLAHFLRRYRYMSWVAFIPLVAYGIITIYHLITLISVMKIK